MNKDTRGKFQAEVLRICLKTEKITESVSKDLDDILQEQFKAENYREVSGVALFKDEWLSLEIVHYEGIKEVEEALDKFSRGDYSGLEKLSQFAAQAVDFHEKHHGHDSMLSAMKNVFRVASNVYAEKLELPYTTERRKELVGKYNDYILGSYTIFPLIDYIDKKGFLGWFHVHARGTKPSPGDIADNRESDTPALVLSALPSYKETGIDIYLLHHGNVEHLYQGLVYPAKK